MQKIGIAERIGLVRLALAVKVSVATMLRRSFRRCPAILMNGHTLARVVPAVGAAMISIGLGPSPESQGLRAGKRGPLGKSVR
jgi:hypothetical protein